VHSGSAPGARGHRCSFVDSERVRSTGADSNAEWTYSCSEDNVRYRCRIDIEQRLRRCAAHIPPSCRQVWQLHDFLGFSTHEISRRLGMPPAVVRSRLRTARKRLRAALTGEFGAGAFLPPASRDPLPDGN
jgi:DNA-directed RNA polymerase specialized sigma24 family protein